MLSGNVPDSILKDGLSMYVFILSAYFQKFVFACMFVVHQVESEIIVNFNLYGLAGKN